MMYINEIKISIHAPREGSDSTRACASGCWISISIHAPREGSDEQLTGGVETLFKISIHAPREGSDLLVLMGVFAGVIFLSTLPARGATGVSLHRFLI